MKYASLFAALIIGACALNSSAQMTVKWTGSDGWGTGTKYEHLFNNYNLQTVNGDIYKIDTVTPMSGMARGIQMIVRTSSREEVIIHLGPAWYIQRQDMNLGLNDKVEIRGARFSLDGKNIIAAFEVRQGSYVLYLRDQDGIPSWCGWRKRKM